jgi:hypothetical protein
MVGYGRFLIGGDLGPLGDLPRLLGVSRDFLREQI